MSIKPDALKHITSTNAKELLFCLISARSRYRVCNIEANSSSREQSLNNEVFEEVDNTKNKDDQKNNEVRITYVGHVELHLNSVVHNYFHNFLTYHCKLARTNAFKRGDMKCWCFLGEEHESIPFQGSKWFQYLYLDKFLYVATGYLCFFYVTSPLCHGTSLEQHLSSL